MSSPVFATGDDASRSNRRAGIGLALNLEPHALDQLVDELAERVALRVSERLASLAEDGWLRTEEAASYLGLTAKRLYDLKSAGAITPDGHDGRTPLYRRASLDRYASSGCP